MINRNKKVALHNLGCKVNAYETEVMEQKLKNAGYEIVPFEPGADIYIINTCTVTNIADRKSRQMLHKAKRMNPDSIVVAAGCYTETDKEKVIADENIDIVVGNNKKRDIIEILNDYFKKCEKIDASIDINHTSEYEEMTLEQLSEHTRAYIKVQDGCNQFCTYCIIPYARGRVRSRKISDIEKEAEILAGKGFKEIVITGIHIGSYGIDFDDKETGLIDVVEAICKIPGIERVRLGSVEPRTITEDFMQRISKQKEICPHFHLSLQSGCDTVLKRMNRKYNTKEFIKSCELIRSYYKNAAITTDVIVGFPGETEEEHNITKKFISEVGFSDMHIFKYSVRHGTMAAGMPNQVPESIKTLRSAELIELCKKMQKEYRKRYIDSTTYVLFEEKEIINEKEYYTGHTKEYVKIMVESDDDITNEIKRVNVTDYYNDEILLAEIVNLY